MPYKNWEDYLANKRKWRSQNKVKVKVIRKRYEEKYPERLKNQRMNYYKKNKELIRKKSAAYRNSHREAYRDYQRRYQYKYWRTLSGCCARMFYSICGRIKNKKSYKHRKLFFTRQEFKASIIASEAFLTVFDTWVRSGYKHALAPSVDRVDNTKDYSLDNIQILTVSENSKKGGKDLKSVL